MASATPQSLEGFPQFIDQWLSLTVFMNSINFPVRWVRGPLSVCTGPLRHSETGVYACYETVWKNVAKCSAMNARIMPARCALTTRADHSITGDRISSALTLQRIPGKTSPRTWALPHPAYYRFFMEMAYSFGAAIRPGIESAPDYVMAAGANAQKVWRAFVSLSMNGFR